MKSENSNKCLDCQNDILIPDNSEVGEIIECTNCGAEMEILSLSPLKLEILEEEK